MKRKLILLVVTIVFLVGFGVILHSPPSMIDAVTGATPKSKKAAQASAQLEGSYVLGINMMSDGLDNENTRNKLKELALDDSETNETDLMKTDISFRLYVSETDYPLVSYAKKLCDRLKQAGFSVDLKEYSNTMMLSRVVSGKYDVFLASDDFIDVTTLTQMDYMIMDSFMLNGVGSSAGKLLAWIGVGILVVHTVIGVILTVQSLQTAKQSGKMYLKQNAIFWARRASGMAILILLLFHIGLFGKVQNGTYILFPFTTVKMVTQLLFVAAIFVHIFINIRPLLVSLGIISYKERRGDIYLILSVLLLFIAGAVIFYYIGWQYL